MASSFDSMWDKLSAQMDSTVDTTLGDSILFAPTPTAPFTTIKGYVIFDVTGETAYEALDGDFATRKRLKVAVSIIPVITRDLRFQHPKLGPEIYQAGGDVPETQGRYWLFDVQKA